jgi:hypothetical protein
MGELTKKKIYLSGKITGLDRIVCKGKFSRAFITLVKDHGIDPAYIVNPLKLGWALEGFDYDDMMAVDVAALKRCDAIYMLNNYEDSQGAQRELEIAKELGLEILYEPVEKIEVEKNLKWTKK